ncbi:RNA polymerase sigma factor [Aurantibacillus circumpalustris]|uniref:RNA polymerase sigma factor n=1 Tax=Aurantibacillus circumpalustris TaxID=3036359 RepID=UPI00295B3D41|nr:sigma-70 family RNA polymerase sigma factor [Aurantibacillus circumpalustris]
MAINPHFHHTNQQLSEELVIIEAAKLNPEKFAPLYDKYYKQIFNYVYQRMDSKDTAFDITGQVFLKALTNLQKYQFKGVPFASWLYRIAHNEVMQLFRTQKDKRSINADIGDLRFICEENEEPFFEEYIPVIKKLIQELNSDDLQMVELRFFEKRPFKEIAEILEITEVNAKVRMYRIIEKLKKSLSKLKM